MSHVLPPIQKAPPFLKKKGKAKAKRGAKPVTDIDRMAAARAPAPMMKQPL